MSDDDSLNENARAVGTESEPARSSSAFGQADPTDGGRKRWDWKSKYPSEARRQILREAIYLGVLLFGIPIVMLVLWLGCARSLLQLDERQHRTFLVFSFAWCSGTLGGVLFDLKWLYHVVARGLWHLDRRLWRVFTPHISGGLSFFMLALMSSGVVRLFAQDATRSLRVVAGLGFLVGYFSDSAIAKLTDVAETLFGTVTTKEAHSPRSENPIPDDDVVTTVPPGSHENRDR